VAKYVAEHVRVCGGNTSGDPGSGRRRGCGATTTRGVVRVLYEHAGTTCYSTGPIQNIRNMGLIQLGIMLASPVSRLSESR
jgi:hypothetical protein